MAPSTTKSSSIIPKMSTRRRCWTASSASPKPNSTSSNLDRTAHFEKLGVNEVLLQMEVSWDRNRLVDPQQFLPLLDRIAKNESYLHISRERAAAMADAIRKAAAALRGEGAVNDSAASVVLAVICAAFVLPRKPCLKTSN